jgi:alkanesulfonate monooxygenase SsuD/methylene tetrahydromethanopterin reductase-like flavin-dependent oxidoreductase (luciferase family)
MRSTTASKGVPAVQFCFFHLMPWPYASESGLDWPMSNRGFDPRRGHDLYATYLDQMVYAEECGFDWVGCSEHHFGPYGLSTNCNLMGAALAQRTRRVRLAMLGSLLPLLNPVRVAEEYATLDVLSGGRLVAGLLRGTPHEYVAYHVPPSQSMGRFEESCRVILRAWTEPEPFGWEGRHYRFRAVSVWPRPLQQPHPPLVMSATNPQSAALAAEHRAIVGLVMLVSLDDARNALDAYRAAAAGFGWTPGPEHVLVGLHTCIADTDREAQGHMAEAHAYYLRALAGGPQTARRLVLERSAYYRDRAAAEARGARVRTFARQSVVERTESGVVLCGTPRTVVEQIRRLRRELDCGILNLNFNLGNMPDAVVRRGMELFRDEVRPQVADL